MRMRQPFSYQRLLFPTYPQGRFVNNSNCVKQVFNRLTIQQWRKRCLEAYKARLLSSRQAARSTAADHRVSKNAGSLIGRSFVWSTGLNGARAPDWSRGLKQLWRRWVCLGTFRQWSNARLWTLNGVAIRGLLLGGLIRATCDILKKIFSVPNQLKFDSSTETICFSTECWWIGAVRWMLPWSAQFD